MLDGAGQLAPPRPTPEELEKQATSAGKLHETNGLVVQPGAYGGVWLRVGCVPTTPWNESWRKLQQWIDYVCELGKGAVYVAVSLDSMQALDYVDIPS